MRSIITSLVLFFAAAAAFAQINPATQINWPTGSSGCVYAPGTNTCVANGGGGGGLAGINYQTSSYTALSGDNGKLIVFDCASACSLTLPSSPPSSTWAIDVQNVGITALTVAVPGSLTLDGVAGAAQMNPAMGSWIWTDGTNYFTERGGIITRSNVIPSLVAGNTTSVNDCDSIAGNCNAITLPDNVSPGHAIVVQALHSNSSVGTPSDTQGDTFTAANVISASGDDPDFHEYVACGAIGGATTISFPGDFNYIAAYEVSNVASSSCIDGDSYGTTRASSSASVSTGSITTTLSYDFLMVTASIRTGSNQTFTEANGYTTVQTSALIDGALNYQSWEDTPTATGSVSDTVTASVSSENLNGTILALKPAANSANIVQGDMVVAGPNGQLQALHAGAAGTVPTSNGPGASLTFQTPNAAKPSVTFNIATATPTSPAAPYVLAPTAGTISYCYFTTLTSDGSTNLVFNVKKNGTSILSGSSATVTAGTSAGTVSTFSLTSGTISVSQADKWEFDITTGTANWTGAAQCY
jgi:hypothetical protein